MHHPQSPTAGPIRLAADCANSSNKFKRQSHRLSIITAGPSSAAEASSHAISWAACTINIAGYSFRKKQEKQSYWRLAGSVSAECALTGTWAKGKRVLSLEVNSQQRRSRSEDCRRVASLSARPVPPISNVRIGHVKKHRPSGYRSGRHNNNLFETHVRIKEGQWLRRKH